MTRRIYVSQGRFALVDDEDAERVARVDWLPVRSNKTIYARTGSSKIGKSQSLMHRLVMRAPIGSIIDHINGDGLDNRKENLRFVTAAENARNRFDHSRIAKHKTGDKLQATPFQLPRDVDAHPLDLGAFGRRRRRLNRFAKRQAELKSKYTQSAPATGHHSEIAG